MSDKSSVRPGEEGLDQNIGYGYDMYPERRGRTFKPKWYNVLLGIQGRESEDKLRCEMAVFRCLQKSEMVRLMLAALKSSGCEVDIRRNIVCEVCDNSVTGGYDPELNQIVVCQNARYNAWVQGVLTHEMIHMFDFCRNNLDFKNIEHLACTEIRAANLTHCSFMSAWFMGVASPFNIRKAHQACVREKAIQSVVVARKAPRTVAEAVVDKVFDKCYNDLEPIGRRIRRNSEDITRAYREAPIYGYHTDEF